MNSALEFNWPIVGHDSIKKFLQTSAINMGLSHAYLFYGPSKVGKTLTARLFAKTVLCDNYKKFSLVEKIDHNLSVPCGVCPVCSQFEKGIHADFHVVDREENEKTGKMKTAISVLQIRELTEKISKRSFQNSYKIIIIPEAHLLNQEAANCLLKTLEEPSPRTIIILISPSKELLLPTILSRCQQLKFLAVRREEIYDYLLEQGANHSEALEFAGISEGRPTVAMNFFHHREKFDEHKSKARFWWDFLLADASNRFRLIEKMVADDEAADELPERLDQLSGLARDLWLMKNYQDDLICHVYLKDELKTSESKFNNKQISCLLRQVEETKKYLRMNVNSRLALENLALSI